MKRLSHTLVVVLMLAGVMSVVQMEEAAAAGELPASIDQTALGSAAETAAGSCWEIKQLRPTVQDGTYWLLTSKMLAPAQFYCDMTTDGGGWVLVGKGRENWTTDYVGQGTQSLLLTPGAEDPVSTTVQLPSRTVDALLDGERVDALADGVRLRRARNATGTTWQESRMSFAGKKDRWNWSFGAETPLSSYSFDGTSRTTTSTSTTFGTDQAYNRVSSENDVNHGYKQGFAYGSSVTGTTSDSSYLWAKSDGAGYADPFTDVYVRPRVTTYDSDFSPIKDAGSDSVSAPRTLKNAALVTPWGVNNRTGDTSLESAVEGQAFTQSGNTMFVGGNFSYVQQDAAGGGRVTQPYLAGFDVRTGELVSTFTPALNEQVHALATLADGSIVAAGEFTQANGAAVTGIVALDPVTGATKPDFKVSIENRVSGAPLRIRSLDVEGGWLYIGGAFTHIAGGTKPSTFYYMRSLGRVSAADGTPATNWNPNFNGTVVSTHGSSDGNRVYAAGYFTSSNTTAASKAAAVLSAPGAALATPTWAPVWSSSANYQQAITEADNRIWVGGSEHSIFSYDPNTFERLSGNIAKPQGGDTQAFETSDGMLFAGSHAASFDYENAFLWPTIGSGWTRADAIKWFGMWDTKSGARIPDFTPNFSMRQGNGIWATKRDSLGNVWAGGDIESVKTTSGQKFSGGFARFKMADSTPPPMPSNVRVTGQTSTTASFAWNTVTDSESTVRYEVLRDDRPVAITAGNIGSITVPKGGSNRFFVRAIDSANNASASSSVMALGSPDALPTPAFTSNTNRSVVTFDAADSNSTAGSVVGYRWNFGDGTSTIGSSVRHTYATAGTYVVWLTITTSNGATYSLSKTVTANTPGQVAPTDIYGSAVYDLDPWAYYRLGEAAGTVAKDSGPDARTGTYVGTTTRGVTGALVDNGDKAISLNGASTGYVVGPKLTTAPSTLSVGIWFKTLSASGGRLIGYSSSNSGNSTSYDRQLFIQNDGKVAFGASTSGGAEQRATSSASYNNGGWHNAVATMSPTEGMRLYVDGALVASNTTATTSQNYSGYWRVGSDRVWSGASSATLNGSLDEAVVFTKSLSAAQVASQYVVGSTSAPTNQAPTAAFSSSSSFLTADFDGGASSDAEGPIDNYAWDFGDGLTALGATVSHVYANPGTYAVRLTVTDAAGTSSSITHQVTVLAPPTSHVVVARGAAWNWRFAAGAPDAGWNTVAFDPSVWALGNAVLGFGATGLGTNIDTFATPANRPVTAYFTKQFQVDDPQQVQKMSVSAVANDGAVFYVNGTEVARANLPAGAISPTTYATSAPSTAAAEANPVVIDVPVSLLRSGTNVISAETHLNYKSTPNATFDLLASLTY